MNVKFGCRHVLWFDCTGKLEWTCSEPSMSELPICMWSAAGLATNAAGAVTAWHEITSTSGAQSELHFSELAAVSGWYWSLRREAQHCSSQSGTESGYLITSVLRDKGCPPISTPLSPCPLLFTLSHTPPPLCRRPLYITFNSGARCLMWQWPARDSFTTEQPLRRVCETSGSDREQHPASSYPQPPTDLRWRLIVDDWPNLSDADGCCCWRRCCQHHHLSLSLQLLFF